MFEILILRVASYLAICEVCTYGVRLLQPDKNKI